MSVVTDHATGAFDSNSSADEDAQLLWQATARAEALLEDLAAGRPAAQELGALLGYLREVVLARIAEEERRVFPSLRQADPAHPDLDRLHSDHVVLRDDIDELAAAAAAHGTPDPVQLAALTRRLIVRLEEHLRTEAAALTALPEGYQPGASGWAMAGHWYSLTEGPLISLDQLPSDQAEDAVLNRLAHLRAGECVELESREDPEHIRRRLQRRAPGDYSWAEHGDDPGGWTVSVTRRQAN